MRWRGILAWMLAAGLVGLAVQAGAQPAGEEPDLRHLALMWVLGDYRAPMVCQVEGSPRRALRGVRVAPDRRQGSRAPANRISFEDLDAPPETHCSDEMGGEEPNVVGAVVIGFESHKRPDTASKDFEHALRRDGGFRFSVRAGRLKIGAAGAPLEDLEVVDFRGGTVRVEEVRRGTDAWRRLSGFGPRRKLKLELEAPSGEALTFHLVQIDG